MQIINYLIGSLLLLYGIIKVTMVVLSFSLTIEVKEKIAQLPVVGWFINNDDSASGRVIDCVLLAFALYCILRSFKHFDQSSKQHQINHSDFRQLIYSEDLAYNVNLLIGFILVDYYVLASYTNVPLPKDENYLLTYKIGGVAGGLAFLLGVPLMYLYFKYNNDYRVGRDINKVFRYYRNKATLAVISAVLLFMGIVGVVAEALSHNNKYSGDTHAFSVFLMSQVGWL